MSFTNVQIAVTELLDKYLFIYTYFEGMKNTLIHNCIGSYLYLRQKLPASRRPSPWAAADAPQKVIVLRTSHPQILVVFLINKEIAAIKRMVMTNNKEFEVEKLL